MSTKGHHATRIMIFLAASPDRSPNKAEISAGENISPGYLQQVLAGLLNAGLVKSYRGKSGGFALARPAAEITVQQVLQATEGKFDFAPCLEVDCPRAADCSAHLLWVRAAERVNELFSQTTIADLAGSGLPGEHATGQAA